SPSRWQSCSFAVQRYPLNPLNCALANSKWLIWRLRRLRFRRKGRARSHHQKKYKQPLLPPESRTAGMKAREITCRTSVFRFARALKAAKETGERTSWRAVRNNDPDAVALFAQHHRADDVTLCLELPMRYVHLAWPAAGLECKF